jgi:hypothetical protein
MRFLDLDLRSKAIRPAGIGGNSANQVGKTSALSALSALSRCIWLSPGQSDDKRDDVFCLRATDWRTSRLSSESVIWSRAYDRWCGVSQVVKTAQSRERTERTLLRGDSCSPQAPSSLLMSDYCWQHRVIIFISADAFPVVGLCL